MNIRICLIFLCLALILTGCGAKTWRKGGTPGAKPYTVRGKTYYPLKSAHGFTEEGVASWYGPGFHGKKTANGETYNQNALTAAHKLLPLGTTVKVTHLGNKKSVTVRVNDRGPFSGDRVLDLSRKSAESIGMIGAGTARVRIQSLGDVPGIREDGDIDGNFYVQVGSFAVQDNAKRLVSILMGQSLSARILKSVNSDLWHVQVGPYSDLFAAQLILPKLTLVYKGAFVVGE